MEARKYDQALLFACQALSLEPANPNAHALAVRALMRLGRHDEAIYGASQVVSLAPQWAYGHRLLSVALRTSPSNNSRLRWKQAVDAAREAVRLAPADVASYLALADACATGGYIQDADRAVRAALQLDPRPAGTWATASFVALKARNWRAAETAARRALAIDPGNYAATNNLGAALRQRGGWTLGAVAFQNAARIDPRSKTARDNVEAIGFHYINLLSVVLLLPLVVVWPLFLAARLATVSWLAAKPPRLQPLARRVGIWVASRERYRRKFDMQNARAQRFLANDRPVEDWSALHGRQRFSSPLLTVIAGALLLTAMVFGAVAILARADGEALGLTIAAGVFAAGGTLMFVIITRRRRRY